MHFITTDSELEIKRNTIYQKRLVVPVRTYWLHSFILLLIYIGYSFYETVTEKPYRWVSVLLGISWIAPHLVTIYRFLFKKSWRQNIPVSKIKSVERKPLNQLEEAVILTLYSGREKSYTFRIAENQAETFTELVNESLAIGLLASG